MKRFLSFCVVGTIGFVIDSSVLMLATRFFGLDLFIGRLLSFAVAVLITWELNYRYTFNQEFDMGCLFYLRKFWKYITSSLVGIAINLGTYYLLIIGFDFFVIFPWLAVAVGSIAALVINYSLTRFWVFCEKT